MTVMTKIVSISEATPSGLLGNISEVRGACLFGVIPEESCLQLYMCDLLLQNTTIDITETYGI